MANEKIIRVMGTGDVSIKPDTTRLEFEVESLHPDYAKAYETAAVGNAGLRRALQSLSIDPDFLKTADFGIKKKMDSVREKGGWKEVFKGFELNQTLVLELPIDGKLVSRVLVALGKEWPDLEVKISYVKKDVKQVKLEMLENAVKDAKQKATVMATALGYTLGNLVSIDYSKHKIDISYHENCMWGGDCEMPEPTSSLDLTPEDIKSSDTVETVWSLK